ncbi:GNAT family N-acetyltransferase [Levilactobacillus zymae]|uniref:GNAT family N-acetyltransferase n=1 Tax=Levilactobacillus zymae TaxID=267363 RepID=UPI0028BA39D7|nr:GNAT family N-acetyltransferase [Levilactobacillus zymae]MDT6979566.1 GNAT family N-acetyltransferase [Levilactobacillus zymae]
MIEETQRVRVRNLVESDLADYQRILAYPVMATANGTTSSTAPDLLAYWFEKDRHSPYAFAVIDRIEHHFIGAILYYPHQNQPAVYDLGYFLEPNAWGHGYMAEAVRESWTLIRREGGLLTDLYADCLPDNHQSQRVLAKLDFQPVAPTSDVASDQDPAEALWFKRSFSSATREASSHV